jgi:uncharacterized protein (TIGR02328 family)
VRIWHVELIPFLPKGQLLSQKRECDLMLKDYLEGKKTNHILINYVWEYDIEHLVKYYILLEREFTKRGYKFKRNYVDTIIFEITCKKGKFETFGLIPFFMHHNNLYLITCFWNLREKYYAHQKDFSSSEYQALYKYVDEATNKSLSKLEKHLDQYL